MVAKHSQFQPNGKRSLNSPLASGPPQKKRKVLLGDEESTDKSDDSSYPGEVFVNHNEVSSEGCGLQVNEDYARRFEYNKRREELGRLQDKYGTSAVPMHRQRRAGAEERGADDLSESSSDEDEDDDGILALGVLDEQVQRTLDAIRKKDPRVYDANVKFYNDPDDEIEERTETSAKQEKPLYLNDYHRKNLLEGVVVADNDDDDDGGPLSTYQQQQADLKNSIVKEMHAAADGSDGEEDSDGNAEDDFLIEKADKPHDQTNGIDAQPSRVILDIESADKDPEMYLSNFMSARGWVTNGCSKFQPFESDDEEEDRRAEAFEEAYNLRFEDPKASNEKLLSHARDAAAKYSVRKEETNPRKKKRDIERARKDAERQLRSEEKARLRKLKVADLQEKLQKIKEAAGWTNDNLSEEDWSGFLNEAWDDDRWEREMKTRFGDDYYDRPDLEGEDDDQASKKKRTKKPRWNDDIDIKDLVPDFEGEGEDQNLPFELTDEDMEAEGASRNFKDSKKTKLKAEQDSRREVRLERRKIEQLVDEQLDVDETLTNFGKKHAGTFRYRETSPLTHGLTAHDILLADDSQLNQFAGLKKLAAFREPDKKRKDNKRLGKKQRLKQWRIETFGNDQGPTRTLAEVLADQGLRDARRPVERLGEGGMREGERTKKRSRKAKKSKAAA